MNERRKKKRKKSLTRRLNGEAPVARWRHNANEIAQVVIRTFGGALRVHLRFFYIDDDGVLQPTKKGVSLRREELKKAARGLRAAYRLLGRRLE
jgi:Transcriptional Coactivator p15 (PC4)